MKILVIVFMLFFISNTVVVAYAHPTPIELTVQDENGEVLYHIKTNGDYGTSIPTITLKQNTDENILDFAQIDNEWLYSHFIWVLTSAVIVIMAPTVIITYREELLTTFKSNNPEPSRLS